jgi:hypothetical protein
MASILKVDTITGVATAGSIAITGEGNSTTTNLQQGLAKQWSKINQDTPAITDSFNTASLTDVGTGEYSCNFTNNMNNANYANSCQKEAEAANADCTEYTTGSNSTSLVRRQDVENNAGRDAARSDTITHGDLA